MAKVRLGDVAIEYKETCKGSKDGYPVVGLEHLVPGDINLTRWDESSENTFTKMFLKGQVLFGRRRAYLKKAAAAPFDGICSGDITVIAAKSDKILPQLLPFIIQNDDLFDFAVGKSAGSLSPRVKWQHLSNYEFELPDRNRQQELARLLRAMDATKQAYKKLLVKTDEMVKSQFIEMFETRSDEYRHCILSEVCLTGDDIKCGPFGTQLKQSEYTDSGVAVWGIPQVNSGFCIQPDVFVTPEKAHRLASFSIRTGDIAMSRKGNVGQCALFPENFDEGLIASDVLRIRVNATEIMPAFLMAQLHYSRRVVNQIAMVSNGGIMAGVNVSKLKSIKIFVPPLSLQNQFAAFVRQSDKSKFELEQSIAELEATYKRILSDNLG
ncbi:MAG: restriction endonuclease subunit S [bacterium]|nr:restriction endonuclease subunit S [bacterium]